MSMKRNVKPRYTGTSLRGTNSLMSLIGEVDKQIADNDVVTSVDKKRIEECDISKNASGEQISGHRIVEDHPLLEDIDISSKEEITVHVPSHDAEDKLHLAEKRENRQKDDDFSGITRDPASRMTNIMLTYENSSYITVKSCREKISISQIVNSIIKREKERLSGKKREDIYVDKAVIDMLALEKDKISRRLIFDPNMYGFLDRAAGFHDMKLSAYMNYLLAKERIREEKEGINKKMAMEVL